MSRHHRFSGQAKGPEWERLRGQAKDRDGWRCQKCGRAGKLEVHHVIELAHGGTNDMNNLHTPVPRLPHRPSPAGASRWRRRMDGANEGAMKRLTHENLKEITRYSELMASLLEEFPDSAGFLAMKRASEKFTIEQDEAAMRFLLARQGAAW